MRDSHVTLQCQRNHLPRYFSTLIQCSNFESRSRSSSTRLFLTLSLTNARPHVCSRASFSNVIEQKARNHQAGERKSVSLFIVVVREGIYPSVFTSCLFKISSLLFPFPSNCRVVYTTSSSFPYKMPSRPRAHPQSFNGQPEYPYPSRRKY